MRHPIVAFNIDSDPPMFTMTLADHDLSKWIPSLKEDLQKQEQVFIRMVECIDHLHENNDRHRDIKPHNFLVYSNRIVVSDLGLAKDPSSDTEFTKSIDIRGTFAFCPPQFHMKDGFKKAEFSDDIFMLGKSFYYMLTGLSPYYLDQSEVNPVVFRVIDKCCQANRDLRYQTCKELRTALVGAYDVLLRRKSAYARYEELKGSLIRASGSSTTLKKPELVEFFELLRNESEDEQISFIEDLPTSFVQQMALITLPKDNVALFLEIYWKFLHYAYSQKFYPFGHAETVARQMVLIFESKLDVGLRAKALHIGLDIAIRFNRGAAAESCTKAIEDIDEDSLAFAVADVMKTYGKQFYLEMIDLVKCRHFFIVKTTKELLATT